METLMIPRRSVVGVISISSAKDLPFALFFSLLFFIGARISSLKG